MIKPHLVHAQLSGCVVTTSLPHSVQPGKPNHRDPDVVESENKPLPASHGESNGQWSCSGVILDRTSGIVICHGAVFFPYLKKGANSVSSSYNTILLADDFPSDLLIKVECPFQPKINTQYGAVNKEIQEKRSGLGLVPMSKPRTEHMRYSAHLLMLFPCPEFQKMFSRLFRKEEGWMFSSEEEKKEYGEFQKDLSYLHWFAILKLQSSLAMTSYNVDIVNSCKLIKGSTVFACGSPFGSFYPDIFLNSISKGVLSNTAGERNVLLLTDARCLPGSEGGGIFLYDEGGIHLVGIIVAPLCWKTNEWVGLTLACSISHIIDSMFQALDKVSFASKSDLLSLQLIDNTVMDCKKVSRPMERMMAAVVLVDSGHSWGSGVLLNPKIVLTCRHVVRNSSKVLVKVQLARQTNRQDYTYERYQMVTGRVVFFTQESSPYDIAVVELERALPDVPKSVLASRYYEGEDVYIVGFGALGENCGPSVTSGVLSAVSCVSNVPVMLQTSCAVHGGSSGGPLFSAQSGEMLGIVASNTRDNCTGATYPHLNFSIPITVVLAAVQKYKTSGDFQGFTELNKVGYAVRDVWRLQRSQDKGFQSKL